MWIKYLLIGIFFYIFAVGQNSFLVHFNILGITPNLVLIFYFLLLFFEKTDKFHLGIFGAFIAGFLLDIFSHYYLGISIVLLVLLMFVVKKVLQILWERSDEYSIIYFISLFILYLISYRVVLNVCMLFLNPPFADFTVNWALLIVGAYNLLFALIGFYIFDKFNILDRENRQLKLF